MDTDDVIENAKIHQNDNVNFYKTVYFFTVRWGLR